MKTKRPTLLFLTVVALLLLVAATVWVLYCGNPQWCKYLYFAQERIYQQEPKVPDGYNGIWREWYRTGSGKLLSKTQYADGSPHGKSTSWSESGSILSDGDYANGEAIGIHMEYFDPVEHGTTGVLARWDYSSTGFVVSMYDETGNRHAHVKCDKQNRIKVIQHWDTTGTLLTTRSQSWDTNGTVMSDLTETNTKSSNKSMDT